MRLIHIIVHIFAIFAFLTIGSLMIIVSLHVLTMEDALLKVQVLYEDPWQSLKMGVSGILFVFIGLVFSKILVKETRSSSDVVLCGKWGYMSVSTKAIEDLARKGLRKFSAIRESKITTEANGSRLKIQANVSVLSGRNLTELTDTVQNELFRKINRLVGDGIELETVVKVTKIIDQNESPNEKVKHELFE